MLIVYIFMTISDTIIQGLEGVVDVHERKSPANTAVPSGPIEMRDCLTPHLINRFSHIQAGCLQPRSQQLTIFIGSLH